MPGVTEIDWADASWNPTTGCSLVSPGCANCYAETLSNRYGWTKLPWTPENAAANLTLHPARLAWPSSSEPRRISRKLDRPIRVFVNSMSDLFHEEIPFEFVERVFEAMAEAPAEIGAFQVLTKRPEHALKVLTRLYDGAAPPERVWIGVSIENARFTYRADVLREVPAAVRFISAEPLLGSLFSERRGPLDSSQERALPAIPAEVPEPPGAQSGVQSAPSRASLDFASLPDSRQQERVGLRPGNEPRPLESRSVGKPEPLSRTPLNLSGIDWLIVGGESGGKKARPMHPQWALELRDACLWEERPGIAAARARHLLFADGDGPKPPAFFFKQWGSWAPDPFGSRDSDGRWVTLDGRSYSSLELDALDPAGTNGAMLVGFVGAGPKSGGKVLDGRQWCEFPPFADAFAGSLF